MATRHEKQLLDNSKEQIKGSNILSQDDKVLLVDALNKLYSAKKTSIPITTIDTHSGNRDLPNNGGVDCECLGPDIASSGCGVDAIANILGVVGYIDYNPQSDAWVADDEFEIDPICIKLLCDGANWDETLPIDSCDAVGYITTINPDLYILREWDCGGELGCYGYDCVMETYGYCGLEEPPTELICNSGDVNGDGVVNVTDVLSVVNHIMGSDLLADNEICTADMNSDGSVTVQDIISMVQLILGASLQYGCTIQTACNYDETANTDDGSCEEPTQLCGTGPNTGIFYCTQQELLENCATEYLGCTDTDACNFDADADIDDGTCEYPLEGYNCSGECVAGEDCNGECGGNAVEDCSGACNGDASFDDCGVCNGTGLNTYYLDADNDDIGCTGTDIQACSPPSEYYKLESQLTGLEEGDACLCPIEIDECGVCGGDGEMMCWDGTYECPGQCPEYTDPDPEYIYGDEFIQINDINVIATEELKKIELQILVPNVDDVVETREVTISWGEDSDGVINSGAIVENTPTTFSSTYSSYGTKEIIIEVVDLDVVTLEIDIPPPLPGQDLPTEVEACTDSEACNPNPLCINSNITCISDNALCIYPSLCPGTDDVYACTPSACPDVDVGPIVGCMDAAATNYNSDAIYDDGSCEYSSVETDVTDIDGNVYQTVQIGDQLWMAENLRVTHYNNNHGICDLTTGLDPFPDGEGNNESCLNDWGQNGNGGEFAGDGAYSIYGIPDPHGLLYNGYAVDDERGLCPEGWEIPSWSDYVELRDYTITGVYAPPTEDGSDDSGRKLKSNDTNWVNWDGADIFDFNAVPTGYRNVSGGYQGSLNFYSTFWTDDVGLTNKKYTSLFSGNSVFELNMSSNRKWGRSVRCIKSPIVDCNGVENGTAVEDCNGDCEGGAYIDDCGSCVGGNTELDENYLDLGCGCGTPEPQLYYADNNFNAYINDEFNPDGEVDANNGYYFCEEHDNLIYFILPLEFPLHFTIIEWLQTPPEEDMIVDGQIIQFTYPLVPYYQPNYFVPDYPGAPDSWYDTIGIDAIDPNQSSILRTCTDIDALNYNFKCQNDTIICVDNGSCQYPVGYIEQTKLPIIHLDGTTFKIYKNELDEYVSMEEDPETTIDSMKILGGSLGNSKIDFSVSFNNSESLLNMGESDKWQFESLNGDKTLFKSALTYYLFDEFGNKSLDFRYVDVMSGDDYIGTYIMRPEMSLSAIGIQPIETPELRDPGVVIVEVMHNNSLDTSDYCIIQNTSGTSTDVGGWKINGWGGEYQLPAQTILSPFDYLIFTKNIDDFNAIYSNQNVCGGDTSTNCVWDWGGGGLSDNESIQLWNDVSELIDKVDLDLLFNLDSGCSDIIAETTNTGNSIQIIQPSCPSIICQNFIADNPKFSEAGVYIGFTDADTDIGLCSAPIYALLNYQDETGWLIIEGSGIDISNIEIEQSSYVDYFILQELRMDSDSHRYNNMYAYNDGESFKFGPFINLHQNDSFNIGYNLNWCEGEEFKFDSLSNTANGWSFIGANTTISQQVTNLILDVNFINTLIDRWNILRGNELDIDNLLFKIDYYYYYLNNRANMNDERWSIYDGFETYDDIVEDFKTWIQNRIYWIDHNIRRIRYQLEYNAGVCENDPFNPQGLSGEITYCDDELASNYNEDSNFNDGTCQYQFERLLTIELDTQYVAYPPIEKVELNILERNGFEVEETYEMENVIDNTWRYSFSQFKPGDNLKYNFTKTTPDAYTVETGRLETDRNRTLQIRDENALDIKHTFNDFIDEFEITNLPIIKIDTDIVNDWGFIDDLENPISDRPWYCPGYYNANGAIEGWDNGTDICDDLENWVSYYSTKDMCETTQLIDNTFCEVGCIDGTNIQDEPKITSYMQVFYNGEDAINSLNDDPQVATRIGIEVRGFSSRGFAKKQYAIETQQIWREKPQCDNKNYNTNLFCNGFNPEEGVDYHGDCVFDIENDFVLLGPIRDRTYMRNAISYEMWSEMGNIASNTKFVEFILNDSYMGLYVMMEKIKEDEYRIPIDNIISDDNPAGGWIIKVESGGEQDFFIGYDSYTKYEFYDPKANEFENDNHKQLIINTINNFEAVVIDFPDGDIDDIMAAFDIDGFVDYWLIQEFARNNEGFTRSQYWYSLGGDVPSCTGVVSCTGLDESVCSSYTVDCIWLFYECIDLQLPRDCSDFYANNNTCPEDLGCTLNTPPPQKIYMGPVWDFNHSYAATIVDYKGWATQNFFAVPGVWGALFQLDIFKAAIYDRWQELKETQFNIENINNLVDKFTNQFLLYNSVDRDQKRWFDDRISDFDDHVNNFKKYILQRISWMDAHICNGYISCDDGNCGTRYPTITNTCEDESNNTPFIHIYNPSENKIIDLNNLNTVNFEWIISKQILNELENTSSEFALLRFTIYNLYTNQIEHEFEGNALFDQNGYGEFIWDVSNIYDIGGDYYIQVQYGGNIYDTVNFSIKPIATQSGCMDSSAVNFDLFAEIDDGSCKYQQDCNEKYFASEFTTDVIELSVGYNTISYPINFSGSTLDLFEVLNVSYFNSNGILGGFSNNDFIVSFFGDQIYSAVYMEDNWLSTNTEGFNINQTSIGMGFILYVNDSGQIVWDIPRGGLI